MKFVIVVDDCWLDMCLNAFSIAKLTVKAHKNNSNNYNNSNSFSLEFQCVFLLLFNIGLDLEAIGSQAEDIFGNTWVLSKLLSKLISIVVYV